MANTRANTINFSLLFLFLVTLVAADFNILIHFFLNQRDNHADTYYLVISAATVILTLILIFSLFSYYRSLEKKIQDNELSIDELLAQNDFFRLLSEQSNDMFHFNDEKGIIKYVNPATTALLGYETAEIIGLPAINFIHPDDREAISHDMRTAAVGSSLDPREIRVLKKNGEWLDVEVKGFSFEHDGLHKYIGAALRDISNRKKKESLLRQHDEWEQTFNSLTDFVSVHDRDFKVLKVNKALCDFLNKKPDEIVGKYCYEIFHKADEPAPGCPHLKSIENQHAVTMDINDPGIGVPLQVTCSPIYNKKNEFQGSVHIARSITDMPVNQANSFSGMTLIPICASCKDIRDENDSWIRLEEYFQKQWRVMFSHCICKNCQKKLYPEFIGK